MPASASCPRALPPPSASFRFASSSPASGSRSGGSRSASRTWGTGLFIDAAQLALDFVFDELGVERLEARAALVNGRGNGALRKLGAVQELVLRRSLHSGGRYLDQALWTILATDWRETRPVVVVGAHTPVH